MESEKESSSNMETSKSDQQPESKEEANTIDKTDEQTRLWAAVKEKPSDFTSWTSLLQIVEQKVLLFINVHAHILAAIFQI